MELMGVIDNKLYSKNIELPVLKDTLVVVNSVRCSVVSDSL